LYLERRKYITWAGKDIITEQDLEAQLFTLNEQERQLKRDLNDARLLIGNRAEKMLHLANLYREHARVGYEAANLIPDTPERASAQFEARRRIIDGLVTRVEILEDKSVKVAAEIQLDERAIYEGEEGYTSDTLIGASRRIDFIRAIPPGICHCEPVV
jgi:hypothetical protein